ncbi:ABC transporter permease, partial [Intestinibacillus massiliensis]|nr:ABC transporter permease [Intestinibacillus massiliensis]
FQMIGINLISYIAVMPVIAFTAQRSGSFMAGVGFAFFYGFVGMMASGHGLRDLYPITAGLTVIGYQDGSSDPTGNVLLSAASILFMLAVKFIIVSTAKNREVTATKKKKESEKTVHKRNHSAR